MTNFRDNVIGLWSFIIDLKVGVFVTLRAPDVIN
jgi:hypothetical protein